jgi:hypothetical protein
MSYLEQIRQTYPDWEPSTISHIRSITLENGDLVASFLFQARKGNPWPNDQHKYESVTLRFKGVDSLKLDFANPAHLQLMGLDMIDIKSSGWEGLRYHVLDDENGSLEFYCKAIDVV